MSSFTHIAGWTLIHFAWQGTLIALLTAAVLQSLRRATSQARYAVACVSLAAMLLSILATVRVLSGSEVSKASGPVSSSSLADLEVTWAPATRTLDLPAEATDLPAKAADLPAEAGSHRKILGVASSWISNVAAGFSRNITLPRIDTQLPAIVTLWLAGVSVLLVRLAGGWWRMRKMHLTSLASAASRWQSASERMAHRLGLNRAIHVVDSSLVQVPAVVGWLRPVIILPVAALANLTPAQVDAILAHELAHIRRHDFIVNLLQTIAETLLFYHPGVWWVSSRIRAEREHCCDDVAVDVCGDAVAYAAALTELETWRAHDATFALAATSGSLLGRVKRVLGASDSPRTSGVMMTAALVVALVVVTGALQYVFALPQSRFVTRFQSDARPVQKDAGDAVGWRMLFDHPSGQLTFRGFTGRDLIRFAYQLPESRILGGPAWIDTQTFHLSTTLDFIPGAEDMPNLVRHLLEERFNFKAHQETRQFPAYAVVIARPDGAVGPNLQPATSDCFDQQEWIARGRPPLSRLRNRQVPFCGVWDGSLNGITGEHVTMAALAEYLSRAGSAFDRRVIDQTGLSGTFDVTLNVFRPAVALMGQYPAVKNLLEPFGLKSLPTALEEQLGLRLVDAMAPARVLVIDRAERPSSNQRTVDTNQKSAPGV